MDKASLKSFSIFNLVLKSVLIYFIAENTGSCRKIYNFSQLLNKFQITLPQIRDYPKRVITPLIKSHCVKETRFPNAQLVAILGALKALYVPLEMKEDVPDKKAKVKYLGVFAAKQNQLELAHALEAGRIVSRDIGGSDPERMAAAR